MYQEVLERLDEIKAANEIKKDTTLSKIKSENELDR